jgi:hypothetical protein
LPIPEDLLAARPHCRHECEKLEIIHVLLLLIVAA